MFVFAHLHKCAGTSVVQAAIAAGMVLPSRHANGHPAGPEGHAAALVQMSNEEFAAFVRSFAAAGVQLLTIEWDFPVIEKFPTDVELQFFTIFRDPVERFLSNYTYDVVHDFTPKKTLTDYLGSQGIWTHPNFYTRFFAGLLPEQAVEIAHVDYVLDRLSSRFKYAFVGDDLQRFLSKDVGMPIRKVQQRNKTSKIGKLTKRSRLHIADQEIQRIRELNELDYRLFDVLKARRRSPQT